jgi:hypothetical protein
MKRTQLIEWGIVTTGLVFGFKFFEGIFSFLLAVLYNYSPGRGDDLIKLAVYFLAYAITFILLIRKSSQIAIWLNGPSQNDVLPIQIGKRSLLQIILISICTVTILSNIATIILYLFETFKNEVSRIHDYTNNSQLNYRFKLAAIETIVAIVLIYFSKDISSWFVRKNETDEIAFQSVPENDK